MSKHICAVFLVLCLPACAEVDPYTTGGVWQPTGVNSRNLATMVVNKGDLIRGRGERGSDGSEAGAAVTRLLEGTPKGLLAAKGAGGP